MAAIWPDVARSARQELLQTTTIRDFTGGWNVIDNELNMRSKYQPVLDNVYRTDDGSLAVRYGTTLLMPYSALTSVNAGETGQIIEIVWYQEHIIIFMSNGHIYSHIPDGATEWIWSDAIAATLPGAPDGWSDPIDFVSTTRFQNDLIACNGIDKPLLINLDNVNKVDYLQDLGSGSNAFTPICRYVTAVSDFVVMAGDPVNPGLVHISSQGTSGTWEGDPDPNNAVQVDLTTKVITSDPVIRGLGRFRSQVVAAFDDVSVVGTLGNIDTDNNHIPTFDDVITGHGSIAHKSMINLGNDLLMCDYAGVPSLRRGIFTAEAEPNRVSELVNPALQENIAHLKIDTTTKYIHAIFNPLEQQYLLFVPNHDPVETFVQHGNNPFAVGEIGTGKLYLRFQDDHQYQIGDTIQIVGATAFNNFTVDRLNVQHEITAIPLARDGAFVEITIPDQVADSDPDEQIGGGNAVQSQAQFTETLCYVYSVVQETKIRSWARFKGWKWRAATRTTLNRLLFTDETNIYVYGTRDFTSHADFIDPSVDDSGVAIDWAWETPWVDFERRMNSKRTRYMGLDTQGYASFDALMFVDQIYWDQYWRRDPALIMNMEAGTTRGYGGGSQPYGGGRQTRSENLYSWTAKFKIAKMRFEGSTTEPLRFISVSLAYLRGSIRR